jgi:23S rRNA pseudouridine1911/1915/1917 synthase
MYATAFPHVDESFWKSKIKSGNLRVDGKVVNPDDLVKGGQITQHSVPPKAEPKVSFNIELLLTTDDYWVVKKTSPLPVHAGGRYENNTLTNILKTAFPNKSIHLINRLDANTTGIVLVALNKKVANSLSKQFENRVVLKTYLALVEGVPKTTLFKSLKAVGKLKTNAGARVLSEGYESSTDFEVLKTFKNKTLLKVTPHSGRTNQIRLHLAGLGLPIVGDLGYKNSEYFKKNPLTYPEDTLFLHAWKLQFYDPTSEKIIEVVCELGEKWGEYIRKPNDLI